jgi:hypothetical protein
MKLIYLIVILSLSLLFVGCQSIEVSDENIVDNVSQQEFLDESIDEVMEDVLFDDSQNYVEIGEMI